MESKKKISAAIAAVANYIKTEEEILCMQAAMAAPETAQAGARPVEVKMWGITGRQQQMQLRSLMQARAFK